MSGSSNGESSGPAGTALPAGSAGSAASAAGTGPAADPTSGAAGGWGDGAPVVLPAPTVRRRGPAKFKKSIPLYHVTRNKEGQQMTVVTSLPQSKEMREMATQLGALSIPARAAPKSAVPAAEKRKRKEELDAKRKQTEDAKRKKDADNAMLQGAGNGSSNGDGGGDGGKGGDGGDGEGGGGYDLEPFRTVDEQACERYLANLEDSDDAGESPRRAPLPEPPCEGR